MLVKFSGGVGGTIIAAEESIERKTYKVYFLLFFFENYLFGL